MTTPNNERLTVFQATEALLAGREAEAAPDEATKTPEIEAPEGGAPEPEPDDAPAIGDVTSGDEPEETPASVAPPTSWPKDQIEEWDGLSPSVKERILAREGEIQSAISEKGRETAEAKQAANRLKTEYEERTKKLDEVFPALVERLKTKWEKVDWKSLAKEDPEKVVQLQVELQEDQALVNRAAQMKAQRDQEYRDGQLEKLLERNSQYKDKALFAAELGEVGQFLTEMGYSQQDLLMISAAEYETARDAMKFRKAGKTADTKAKEPAQKSAKPAARQAQIPIKQKVYSDKLKNIETVRKGGGGLNAQLKAAAEARLAAKG